MDKALRTGIIISGSTILSAIPAIILYIKANKHFSERLNFQRCKFSLCGET